MGSASRAYVVARAVSPEASIPIVRAPARIAFRDGAVSEVNLPLPGRVVTVHVQTGDRVAMGAPLITLTSPEAAAARASLATAHAEHDAAAQELARQDTMIGAGVGIESERAAARARLRQNDAELARAQTTVGLLGDGSGSTFTLRAPIAGTVIARRATVGSVAQPGAEPLVEIGDPSALWIVADVFERDLANVHTGAGVAIELPTAAKPAHGHVVAIGSAVSGVSRTAPVYIAVDDRAGDDLRAGMFARAAIEEPAGRGVVLPVEAVLVKDGKRTIVYVESGPDRYTPRDVVVGRSIDGKVLITSGITAGEHVVLEGALLLDSAAEQLL
ncbi:MAG: efflux RND transporter periplasmic adaptor subunit [Proteobacteria bacterium]|nr:efflux RND transporter periplasmic adaptor subunit [Pseudomonadota bacterium]